MKLEGAKTLHLLIVGEGLKTAKAPDLDKDIHELASTILGDNTREQHVELGRRDIILTASIVGNHAF